MSDNIQNDKIQKMISDGKENPSVLIEREVEEAIELLHGDLRSINRQIRQRKMKIDFAVEFGEDNLEEKEKLNAWLQSVKKVANNKFDQIRILERVLGDVRNNNVGPLTKAHFHVRILKEIALKVDEALATCEEQKTETFSAQHVRELKEMVDDLYGLWKELFE